MRALSRWILRLFGWRAVGSLPGPKCVVIGAPHTTNWDFPLALLVMWALEIPGRWVGKHTIFRPPFGWLMRRLRGIPLDRERTKDFVPQVVERFNEADELVIVIAPEGTRSRTEHWRSGFYWIAHGARVPIVLGFVDFSKKEAGLNGVLIPSGDLEADMDKIRDFYADKVGKRPEKTSMIRVRPRDSEPPAPLAP